VGKPVGKRLAIVRRWTVHAAFAWEPRDIWVGCYWDRTPLGVRLYLCAVPCLPLIVDLLRPISFGGDRG